MSQFNPMANWQLISEAPWIKPGQLIKSVPQNEYQTQFWRLILKVAADFSNFEGLEIGGVHDKDFVGTFGNAELIDSERFIPVTDSQERSEILDRMLKSCDKRVENLERSLSQWIQYQVQIALATSL